VSDPPVWGRLPPRPPVRGGAHAPLVTVAVRALISRLMSSSIPPRYDCGNARWIAAFRALPPRRSWPRTGTQRLSKCTGKNVGNAGRRSRLCSPQLARSRRSALLRPRIRAAHGLDRASREPVRAGTTAPWNLLTTGDGGATVGSSSSAAPRSPLRIDRCGADRIDGPRPRFVPSFQFTPFLVVCPRDGTSAMSTTASDCASVSGEREIVPDEARIVERIFQEFVAGVSPKQIAKTLNREGVAGPFGGAWSPSTIYGNGKRGTGILNNELYVGRLVWNRLRYLKNPDTGKRVSRLNPEAEWMRKEVPDLRIISDELWTDAKGRQEHGRRAIKAAGNPGGARRPQYLFSGLTKCGVCGAGFIMTGKHRLGCFGARDQGRCDNHLTIRRDEVEARVLRPCRRSS
jgi:hypothetical protein